MSAGRQRTECSERRTSTEGLQGPTTIDGTPNSARLSILTRSGVPFPDVPAPLSAPAPALSFPFPLASGCPSISSGGLIGAAAYGGGLADDSRRLPCLTGDTARWVDGDAAPGVARRTPDSGELVRELPPSAGLRRFSCCVGAAGTCFSKTQSERRKQTHGLGEARRLAQRSPGKKGSLAKLLAGRGERARATWACAGACEGSVEGPAPSLSESSEPYEVRPG